MSKLIEVWKPIMGYEGFYEVSNLGKIRSVERCILRDNGVVQTFKTKNRKTIMSPDGYYKVSLYKDGKGKLMSVARLVAKAFLPNPENKPCIDHVNTDKTDNRVIINKDGSIDYDKSNLRWATHKENNNNPLTILNRSKPRNWKINKWEHWKSKPIVQFSKNNILLGIYPNAYTCGIRRIGECCNGKRKTAGGYIWKYLNDYLADILEEIQDEDMAKERVV